MSVKKIKHLFIMSLIELAGLWGCILYAYIQEGTVSMAAGAVMLVLMVFSFTGSVYGIFEMKAFKEKHNHMGMAGTCIHVLVFLIIMILYIVGML